MVTLLEHARTLEDSGKGCVDFAFNFSVTVLQQYLTYDHLNATMAAIRSRRTDVIQLYKNLLHMGKEYPLGYVYFREKLKTAFLKNRDERQPEKIDMLLARGEFVTKEIEALYMLKKYRTLKRRYYKDEELTEANKIKTIEEFAGK